MQAHAELGGRSRAHGSTGISPWLVFGIVVLAVSLVAVGAAVVLGSLRGVGAGVAQQPDPTPTPVRPTPGIFVVGKQGTGSESDKPTAPTEPGSTPVQTKPSGGSNPVFSPLPPLLQPSNSSPPAGADPTPSNSPPVADPSRSAPAPQTGAASSPATASSPAASTPIDEAVAQAFSRLSTDEEKVGQLLLLAWIGSTAEQARPALDELRAGGIVFVQNASTSAEARTINDRLKQIARDVNLVDPLIAIDHEGGIVQRIKDVKNEGNNWEFAQTNPTDARACERGKAHAQVLSSLGFSMNLAPVLDVNNNPANPVIGKRSYSDDPNVVARLGAAYIRGLQGGGIAAVGKHFPGHGNTSVDSHYGLPSLPQTVDELERIELVPFRRAIEADIAGIMSAHIVFPAVDPSGDPATLSRNVMTGVLRERLGFKGLAVSDDMGAMKAITDNYAPGQAAVQAVQGGVDFLILSSELTRQRQARDGLLEAVRDGRISPERLDEAVRNVLTVKARFGLLGNQPQTGGGCQ